MAEALSEIMSDFTSLTSHIGPLSSGSDISTNRAPAILAGRNMTDLKLDDCEMATSPELLLWGGASELLLACYALKQDEKVWSNFPEELFERVLAHLPVASFFRFQTVCKSWSSHLHSHSFLRLCSELPAKGPWFYTITHENINSSAVYDPQSNKWYHISLPSFPQKGIVLPVASAGGLVCFLDIGLQHFFVSNPLLRSCRELPSRQIKWWSRKAVGMVVDRVSKAYKLIWLDSSGDYEVYNSFDNSWTSSFMPRTIRLPLALNFRSQPVNIDGVLYFMRTKPDGLLLYDTNKNYWEELQVPLPPSCMDNTLAECRGQILMVGLMLKNDATFVCIWELQRMTWLWKEVDRMPNVMCFEFNGRQIRMTCLGNRSLVLLSLRCRQLNRLILYHLSKRLWFRVPSCFLPHTSKQQWIACGTSFEPTLSALV